MLMYCSENVIRYRFATLTLMEGRTENAMSSKIKGS